MREGGKWGEVNPPRVPAPVILSCSIHTYSGLGEGASNATAFIFHTERGGAAGGFRKTPPSEMSSLGSRFFSAPAKNTQEPGGVTWRHWRDRKPLTHRAAGGSAGHGPSDRTQRPGLPGLQRRGHRGGTAQLGTGTRGLCRCLQLPHSRRPQYRRKREFPSPSRPSVSTTPGQSGNSCLNLEWMGRLERRGREQSLLPRRGSPTTTAEGGALTQAD
nr:uncharacterized protein LOC106025653 isoform X2 [Cavia porcellus]